jgi:hypothetical protein
MSIVRTRRSNGFCHVDFLSGRAKAPAECAGGQDVRSCHLDPGGILDDMR